MNEDMERAVDERRAKLTAAEERLNMMLAMCDRMITAMDAVATRLDRIELKLDKLNPRWKQTGYRLDGTKRFDDACYSQANTVRDDGA